MRYLKIGKTEKLWLSVRDTYDWAHRDGAMWPCSYLSGKPLFAEFNNGDLVDIAISYGRYTENCPGDEFTAITDDFLASHHLDA